MNSNIVRPGDKVEIRILQQVEQGKKLGEQPPVYYSIVENIRDDGFFEVLVPTKEGKTQAPPRRRQAGISLLCQRRPVSLCGPY